MEKYTTYSGTLTQYTIREETLYGQDYIVVPAVMMVEGVHSGSRGAIYHSPTELSQYLESWNNRPVTVGHPQIDGEFVSANLPEVLEQAVGKIFNAEFTDGKLRAEVWVNKDKIQALSPEAADKLTQGQPLDVSVGIFTDEDHTQGVWQGEHYEAVARNYRPDHLALLPNARGACSWDDGCGIRVNQQKGGTMVETKTLKELSKKGYAVHLITNEQGYQELLAKVQSKLNAMDNDRYFYYLEELYDNYIVYKVHDREGGMTLYKRGYTIQDNGDCQLMDNAQEVRREVSYVTMQEGMKRTKPPKTETEIEINNKNQKTMANEKKPCCEAKVDSLIANQSTKFTAKDRDWLMAMEESQIDRLGPVEPKTEAAPQVNEREVIETFKTTLKTLEDYMEIMPEGVKAEVATSMDFYKDHRKSLVKSIMDNTELGEDELTAMSTATLEKLNKQYDVNDYSGQAAGGEVHTNGSAQDDDLLLPPGVESK